MRKIALENFDLKKITTNKKITISFSDGTDTHEITSPEHPHPDLLNALKSFNNYFAYRIGLTDGINAAIQLHPNDLELSKVLDTELKRVSVYGAAWVGKDNLAGIKLIGDLKCEVSGFSITTPVIVFESDKLGFESDVYDLSDNLVEEVYKFLFEGKKSQLDIMSAIEESESENEHEFEEVE